MTGVELEGDGGYDGKGNGNGRKKKTHGFDRKQKKREIKSQLVMIACVRRVLWKTRGISSGLVQ